MHISPQARHISLNGFVAGLNGEMNRIEVDEEIFDHVGMRISGVSIVPPDSYRDGGSSSI